MFDLWRTKANKTFNYWVAIPRGILPISQIEEVKKDEQKYQEIWEGLSEYELIMDSAEQAIGRPGDYQERKKYYSGKKKIHTLENQFRVLPGSEDIVDISIGQLAELKQKLRVKRSIMQFRCSFHVKRS